jgi:SsrA-binding protein
MKLLIPNKKINVNYFTIDKYEAGIALNGNEVKSIVASNANINDAFCFIKNNEMYLLNAYIAPYKQDSKINKFDPYRKRKLLLHKAEIAKIEYQAKKNKLTLIPSQIYLNKNKVKVEIVLAKNKKQ